MAGERRGHPLLPETREVRSFGIRRQDYRNRQPDDIHYLLTGKAQYRQLAVDKESLADKGMMISTGPIDTFFLIVTSSASALRS